MLLNIIVTLLFSQGFNHKTSSPFVDPVCVLASDLNKSHSFSCRWNVIICFFHFHVVKKSVPLFMSLEHDQMIVPFSCQLCFFVFLSMAKSNSIFRLLELYHRIVLFSCHLRLDHFVVSFSCHRQSPFHFLSIFFVDPCFSLSSIKDLFFVHFEACSSSST